MLNDLSRQIDYSTYILFICLNLHLVELRSTRLGPNVQNVDPRGDERWQDQAVPLF